MDGLATRYGLMLYSSLGLLLSYFVYEPNSIDCNSIDAVGTTEAVLSKFDFITANPEAYDLGTILKTAPELG